MRQYNRVYRLLIGQTAKKGLLLTNEGEGSQGLKISFKIDKDTTKETNKSEIKIWNLSDESLELIEHDDIMLELAVGYKDNVGAVRIFLGSLIKMTVDDENEGTDVVATIKASDGQIAIRDSIISISNPPGVSNLVVLRNIANNMGLTLDIAPDVEGSPYPDGFSFVGYSAAALDQICGNLGCEWSIQNEVLQVILKGGTTGKKGLVFSPSTGLIGRPKRIIQSAATANKKQEEKVVSSKRKRKSKTIKKKKKKKVNSIAGWTITTLLAPTVNPGDAIRIESGVVSGWFRVEAVTHKGGNFENDWTSEIDCIEVLLDESE